MMKTENCAPISKCAIVPDTPALHSLLDGETSDLKSFAFKEVGEGAKLVKYSCLHSLVNHLLLKEILIIIEPSFLLRKEIRGCLQGTK